MTSHIDLSETLGETSRFQWSFHPFPHCLLFHFSVSPMFRPTRFYPNSIPIFWWLCYTAILCNIYMYIYIYILLYIHTYIQYIYCYISIDIYIYRYLYTIHDHYIHANYFHPLPVLSSQSRHRSLAACCLTCGTWQTFWRKSLVETTHVLERSQDESE